MSRTWSCDRSSSQPSFRCTLCGCRQSLLHSRVTFVQLSKAIARIELNVRAAERVYRCVCVCARARACVWRGRGRHYVVVVVVRKVHVSCVTCVPDMHITAAS